MNYIITLQLNFNFIKLLYFFQLCIFIGFQRFDIKTVLFMFVIVYKVCLYCNNNNNLIEIISFTKLRKSHN